MNKAIRTEVIDTTNRSTTLETCRAYIDSRSSGYEFRSIRYEAVLDALRMLGMKAGDSITDVGGADGEFGKYLAEQNANVNYKVVDGMLDGTDLNNWTPQEKADFMVSIEVIEHLKRPRNFLEVLDNHSIKGAVLTTPNPHVVDVIAMDATHISPTYPVDFYSQGYNVYPAMLFFENGDSLLHRIHTSIFHKWLIALRNGNQECMDWYGDGMKLLESLMPDVPPTPTLWERFVIWWRG